MKSQEFLYLLQNIHCLNAEQALILQKCLPDPESIDLDVHSSALIEQIIKNFEQSPYCPRCQSKKISRWGFQNNLQRYCCNHCKRTFNVLSKTPLSYMKNKAKAKLDQYLTYMEGNITLRSAAKACDIALKTSFYMRHRLMAIIEKDQSKILTGISELDETFFLESHTRIS